LDYFPLGHSDERGECHREQCRYQIEHDRNRGGGHKWHLSDERREPADLIGWHEGNRHTGGHGELSHPQKLPSRS